MTQPSWELNNWVSVVVLRQRCKPKKSMIVVCSKVEAFRKLMGRFSCEIAVTREFCQRSSS